MEIICDELNIRQKADFNSKVVGTVKRGEVYTIIKEENGLGKLKSGIGYIFHVFCIETNITNA